MNRRAVIFGIGGLLLTGVGRAKELLALTPAQTAGPFYPVEPPLDDDNDLTRVGGRAGVAQGEITDLTGRILDLNGRPLNGLRIEIWQCDARGYYRHPRDRGGDAVDPDFQGFGHAVTDADGRYRFRTIKPVSYPGRTPHIHVAVFPLGERPFVTQLYIKDDPRNAQDFIFNHVPAERRQLVVAEFSAIQGGASDFKAHFDIVIAGADGTPSA